MILSILALAAAVGLAVMFCFIMKDKQILGLIGAFMGIAGGKLQLLISKESFCLDIFKPNVLVP